MASTPLKDKTAIITGGAGGLGKAIAAALLNAGASVLISDINSSLLSDCAPALSSLGTLHTLTSDVADEASVIHLFATAASKLGKVDILINNAGLADRFDGAADLDKNLWDRILAVNLTGPYMTTKHAITHFLNQGDKVGGVIVNIGSVASQRGATAGICSVSFAWYCRCDGRGPSKTNHSHPLGAAYTASKHGLLGLTKNTAAYYADENIRCNILLPGGMRTNIGDQLKDMGVNQMGYGKMQKCCAVGMELVEIDKVAKMCVFLASEDGAIFNGAVISADKGWSAH